MIFDTTGTPVYVAEAWSLRTKARRHRYSDTDPSKALDALLSVLAVTRQEVGFKKLADSHYAGTWNDLRIHIFPSVEKKFA